MVGRIESNSVSRARVKTAIDRLGASMGEAGKSAGFEVRRQIVLASEHERLAVEARERAQRFSIAHRTEQQVAVTLAVLSACGYTFLHDRGWPGSRRGSRGQIDHVLVGPGGVFIVDTKSWREVTIENGRISRGQSDETDGLAGLADVGLGTEAALAEIGLAAGEVHVVVVLAGSSMAPTPLTALGGMVAVGEGVAAKFISGHGRRLTDRQQNVVLQAAISHFPVLGDEPSVPDLSIPEPIVEPEPMLTIDEIADVFLAEILAAPVEEWMTFLHPDQAKLVRRSFSGPARIRGAAGTGKTVVGLHRAAYLARASTGRVIVTTYVSTLPSVLGSLLVRLAPEVADRVEFTGVHALARRVLVERGHHAKVQLDEVTQAFNYTWLRVGRVGLLDSIDANSHYWRDEISYVIKGRGLTSFEQYQDLARTGRRRPLRLEQRRAVWELFLAYEEALRDRGLIDWEDLILRAEASVRERPLENVAAVIVDEAQDLSCAMIRMLHALVGDQPDAFTLIGDGQQTIYPGGYTLAEAGISVAGRGVVLSTNYRNTREIAAFAAEVVNGDEFADIEGGSGVADPVTDTPRTGAPPELHSFNSITEHDTALVAQVKELLDDGALPGDIAVLCMTNRDAEACGRSLSSGGHATITLTDYSGTIGSPVKIGTISRAKGLEFKQVLLARIPARVLGIADDDIDDGQRERRALERRQVYVGMTRARDALWVGTLAAPRPRG